MDRRKQLTNEYRQGGVIGGIYRVTNTCNGMYLLDYATNIQSKKNSFNFMVSSGSCVDYRLNKDWTAFGGEAFVFEILEVFEKKKEQTQDEFIDDLKMLGQLWREKLNASTRY
jgi:hypothetical protein